MSNVGLFPEGIAVDPGSPERGGLRMRHRGIANMRGTFKPGASGGHAPTRPAGQAAVPTAVDSSGNQIQVTLPSNWGWGLDDNNNPVPVDGSGNPIPLPAGVYWNTPGMGGGSTGSAGVQVSVSGGTTNPMTGARASDVNAWIPAITQAGSSLQSFIQNMVSQAAYGTQTVTPYGAGGPQQPLVGVGQVGTPYMQFQAGVRPPGSMITPQPVAQPTSPWVYVAGAGAVVALTAVIVVAMRKPAASAT